jgi:type IV fimbrial biogenesis protein FimT
MLRRAMKAKHTGFTLIELMFTIVVLAVLLGLAAPNFRDFLRNSRLTTAANELLADAHLARSEAIKRRAAVSICSTADPHAEEPDCRAPNATNFSGWLVFVDDTDGDGRWDAGEEILRRRDPVPDGVTVKSDTGMISYAGTGFLRSAGASPSARRVIVCDERGNAKVSGDRSAVRVVTLDASGRAGVARNYDEVGALLTEMGVTCP